MAVRDYGFSDGELKQYADEIISSIKRDIVEFSERGVTATRLNALQQKLANFDELPIDLSIYIICCKTRNTIYFTIFTAFKDSIKNNYFCFV